MLRKRLLWLFTPVLLTGLLFLGGCHRPSPEKIADHIVGKLTSELKLDAAQQQTLAGIKTEALAKLAEMKKSRDAAHEEVLAELEKDTLDPVQLKKLAASHQQEMHSVVDLMIDRFAAFHASLNPEQKQKLVALIREMHDRSKSCCFGD